jgi:hypothetical protein
MNRPRQARCRVAAIFAAAQLAAFSILGQTTANVPPPEKSSSAPTNAAPQARSPVDFFRQLLAMPPDEREKSLALHPPEIRDRILAKVAEYEALDLDRRELRLRATELRWYLMPLLRDAPTNRAAQLAQVPDDLRALVQSRLEEWMILPPPLQQEFLDNERTLAYFTHIDPANGPPAPPTPPGLNLGPGGDDQTRWNALSENQRRQITAQFNQFFDLTPEEKQETLDTLSTAERAQMEQTLQSFAKLPPAQRDECIRAFAKFADMSAPEKEEFLKNAARWSQMSPKERQTWRDLVQNVPEWPPLPPGFIAGTPTPMSKAVLPAVATNRN